MEKKNYSFAYQLIHSVNEQWTGLNHDLVVQFACMDSNSFVKIHHDKDISSQFILSFGEYLGGDFMLFNQKNNRFEKVNTYNKLVQLDGRIKHYVSNVTDGYRFSVIYYKMYDRRFKEQPYFTGTKTYDLT